MDSPPSNANNQIVLVSGVASRRHEEPSVDQGGGQARAAGHAPAPVQNNQLLIPEHDREYGCRYCHKKFSNKQALGGHQNAHKVERAMEKNEQDNGIGYLGSPPSSYHGRFTPFLTSYNHRPNDFMHRSPYSWSFTSHHPGGGGGSVIPYSSRPLPPAAGGYYSGWSSAPPGPRMGPFPGRPHYPLPGQNINIRLANFGAGSSNNNAVRPGFPGSGGRPGGANNGPSVPINLRNVPAAQQSEESDLDLSLKL